MKTLQHFCDCSGGEAQRVWIATVLAQQPDLLFLDEPTAFLDISYQVEVMQLVKKLNRENGMAIVMVLHDLGQALEVSDRVVVIQNGKKYAEGPPEELLACRGLYYALWKEERSRRQCGWKERGNMNILTAGVDYFIKGGWVMWPLLFCSIAALAIGVERMLFFRKADSGREFTKAFCTYVENNDWYQAKELADHTQGEIAKLATIVMERHDNYGYLENFISYRAERALDKFEKNLPYLNIIVTLAPVLGLLGTVTGMMGAFTHLTQRMTNPMGVTSGLAEALITTVFGLCISIIAVVFHGYFERRMKTITLNIEEMGNTLLEAVRKKETCSECCHPERRRA